MYSTGKEMDLEQQHYPRQHTTACLPEREYPREKIPIFTGTGYKMLHSSTVRDLP
jgi:hypothetical protein